MNSQPKVIAHRGASGHAPEMTLEAYRLALQMGVDAVEMDVHRLRDGTIVAIHDADVARTTNGKGLVSEITLPELKTLDAGSWFNRDFPQRARPEFVGLKVPTLQEIADLINESTVDLYVEIKDPHRYAPDFESALLAVIKGSRLESRTRFISFDVRSLAKIKELDPGVQTGLLIKDLHRDPVGAALQISANEIGLLHTLATRTIIDAAHKNGLSIVVWTVNAPEDLQKMLGMEVDGITTNFPDRLIRLLQCRQVFPPS
jgi:glycerophosphoryl diester phosphodiesterase